MEDVLYTVNNVGLVWSFDVQDAFDTQNVAANERHQNVQPCSQ